MFEAFYNNPIIQKLAIQKRWTISDNNKVPIDMTDLLESNGRIIHGALTKKENHNPFVDLYTLMKNIPNAANNAYSLDAKTDGIMVLDIEPKCPRDIAEKLLRLPALYGEFSMSGKGYHLIFPVPKEFEDIYSCCVAVKEEHGYYEFLCNHCITFTRNIIPAGHTPGIGTGTYQDFVDIWTALASNVDLTKRDVMIDVMKDEEDTEWTDYVQKILTSESKAYKKSPSDFNDDMSRYEHGYTGHVYFVLLNVLKQIKVFYTKSEMIWEVFRATSELIPYRDKHDTIHNGMPWLLYQASVIVNKNYDETEMHAMTDRSESQTSSDESSDEDMSSIISGDSDAENEVFEYTDSSEDYSGNNYDDEPYDYENPMVAKTEVDEESEFGDYEENASSYSVGYYGDDE